MIAEYIATRSPRLIQPITITFLAVLILSAAGCDDGCAPKELVAEGTSPDKVNKFIVELHACASGFGNGSSEYTVKISKDIYTEVVFQQETGKGPVVYWDKNNIVIEVQSSGPISTSLHNSLGIYIEYRLSKYVSPVFVYDQMEISRKELVDGINSGSHYIVGGKKEQNLREADERFDREWDGYSKFFKWAVENQALHGNR